MKQVIIAIILGMVVVSGCQTLGDSPEQIADKVQKAADARENLWVNLQIDKGMFSAEEWGVLEGLHGQAIELAAEIEVGLSLGTYPTAETVDEWILVGNIIYDEASPLLDPRMRSLSPATRAAWAVEKARLKALEVSGKRYIDNPNASTYRAVARVGLGLISGIL